MKKLFCLLLAFAMVMAMAACADENKDAYEAGVTAYNAGDYETAAEMLASVGDYKDAASLLATIKAEKTGATVSVTTPEGTVTTEVSYVLKNNNIVKETIIHADGTETKNYYKYDENGLCTSETLNQADGGKVVINHLCENGIRTRTIRTNANKSKDTFAYTCDENGKVLSHVLTKADNTVIEASYAYNEAGLLAEITSEAGVTTFRYNAFGDLIKETTTENGVVTSESVYSYHYLYIVG